MDNTGSARPRRYEAVTILMPSALRAATARAAENELCSMSDIIRSALLHRLHADGLITFDDLMRPTA
jgi:hypothetical protein